MRPFFTYTGGKYRLGPRYPAPVYDTIIEPFAGGAGYSIRHHEKDVVLIDLDRRVATLWEYLIAASPREIMSLPLFDGTWESTDDLHYLSEGESLLIQGWLNKGCFAKRPSAWMRSEQFSTQFWGENIRQRVAEQVPLIKHWKIIHGGYQQAPDQPATWFVDPPYEIAGKTYAFGSSGLGYPDLAEWCRSRPGQVIVCENVGAQWLPFTPFADSHAMRGSRRKGRSAEAVWVYEENDVF